jgi:8-oxo-dGTP diphosphatase/2-hydroxy-dATP diphosphatase
MTEEVSLETVSIIYDKINDRVLLGMKKRGFGNGKWNGLGGKYDSSKDKNLKDTARRELKEETNGMEGLIVDEMGVIIFRFPDDPAEKIHEVHFFRIDTYIGDAKETEEMHPRWFPIKQIPYDQMWPDDFYWMPMLLKGKKFKGEIDISGAGGIARGTLKVVERL